MVQWIKKSCCVLFRSTSCLISKKKDQGICNSQRSDERDGSKPVTTNKLTISLTTSCLQVYAWYRWHKACYHLMDWQDTKQCFTMSLESTSAPWASNNCTIAVLPSWAAMWSGVRSTFVLASRDMPARRSTSAVVTWPYWAARWRGLVPSCQQILCIITYCLRGSHKISMCFNLYCAFLNLFCSQHGPYLYLLLSFHILVSS